jgi:hypothetical protein
MHLPFKRDVRIALSCIFLSFVVGTIVGAWRPAAEEGTAFTAQQHPE